MYETINKMPKFYVILARKISKIPEFYMTFARKMPEFYITIAPKIFFPNFRGAHAPPPVSYTCVLSTMAE